MSIRVGINGFGRIGRNFFRAARQADIEMDIVAVNDLCPLDTMAHLLKYDSVLGPLSAHVSVVDDALSIDGNTLTVLTERSPRGLPWADLGVDVAVESTGIFNSREQSAQHLEAGAPAVIVSAPCSNADATFVVGVNEQTFDPARHKVVSNASCTTNCFVPMVKVLDDAFGVRKGLMTTVHAYTGDQSIVDGPHSDLRRARAAAINIIPTSTGAARATGLVLQAMQGKLDGIALRVPVPTGSLTDFTAVLETEPSVDEINAAFFKAASDGPLATVIDYTDSPIVSSDIVTSPASCTFDAGITLTLGSMVKIAGWYDNEWGYSNRLVDLAVVVAASSQ